MPRPRHLHIPIEIVRAVIAIAETGSLSKAADRLGLSQPAISAQVKRLQSLVGGALFVKTANGTTTTELGKLALQQARRIMEANDQLLRLGGYGEGPQALRLGISALFADEFIGHQSVETLADVVVHIDLSPPLVRGLIEGYIDVAFIYQNSLVDAEVEQMIVDEVEETSVWVRARDFVLRPGAPIPILGWPGEEWLSRTLTKHGIPYKIVLMSSDLHTRLAAARAGIGLTAIPSRLVPPFLVRAREYYLPELPSRRTMLCVRPGVNGPNVNALVRQISSLFLKRPLIVEEAVCLQPEA